MGSKNAAIYWFHFSRNRSERWPATTSRNEKYITALLEIPVRASSSTREHSSRGINLVNYYEFGLLVDFE